MDVIELGRGVRTGRAAAPTTRSRVRIPGRPCSTRPVSTGTRAFANNFKADNLKCFFLLPFEWCLRALSLFEVFCQPCDCRREYIDLSWFYASSFPFLPQKNCLNHSSLEVSSHRRHWPQCIMSSFSQFDDFSSYLLTWCVFHSTSTYFTEK